MTYLERPHNPQYGSQDNNHNPGDPGGEEALATLEYVLDAVKGACLAVLNCGLCHCVLKI